jgi:diguanylate cyclase (GGDEF)-like protein
MPGTAQPPVSIAQIDREIGRRFRDLAFSAPIERLFLRDYLNARAPMVPLWAFLGTLFYVTAALGDLSMIPDVAQVAVGLRLGVFVPYAAMVVIIMRLWPSAMVFDLLSLGVGLLGIALPMIAMVQSTSDHLFVYQTGSVATLAFFTIVLRPRFVTVLVGLAAMLAIQLATTKLSGRFDDVTYAGIVSFYITIAIFLAASACFGERMDRQNFLNRLRGEALQAELTRLSERDPMTGLYNRHVLRRLGNRIWTQSAPKRIVAVIMLDIDHFKRYNDIHGHVDGDACIRAVAHAVQEQVGDQGAVIRYGGEEMLVLMPDARRAHAIAVAEAIRAAIETAAIPHRGLPQGGVVTASLGVAIERVGSRPFDELLRDADAALYEAKRIGRNRVRLSAPPSAFSEMA